MNAQIKQSRPVWCYQHQTARLSHKPLLIPEANMTEQNYTCIASNFPAQYLELNEDNRRIFIDTLKAVISNNIPALQRIKALVPTNTQPIIDEFISLCSEKQGDLA